ncbi:metal ABC transporter solute-binding protein, Zn/Mn family [Candidatus Thiosymbion oneisti]|uniref:metal ABC transporter solute-binding protein, Zn/Mn family n=1 Tax=Candidatus Thiosymbion oneisti TaxID=589554 RepID=UPI000B7F0919|nr:zinc ABC transporter substrate-binding protein [Candidatus Thiosymbion oneisti]
MRYTLLLLLLVSAVGPAVGRAEPLRVFASVVPIRTCVERVGGEHVDARAMVRPGYNPHTYDPTPQQISALAKAVLYVRAGVPFEDAWMERIRSANPAMQILDVRSGIDRRELEAQGHDGDGDAQGPSGHDRHQDRHGQAADHAHHHASDPHVWTSPPLVKHLAGVIRARLAELDPAHAADFARNHAAYVAELEALDRELRTLLEPLRNRKFMVFHPAWSYFAATYGLVQIPIEREGKEPGPRALTALIEQARREQVKVVFVQPQFSRRSAEQVARAIGGRVVAIDPLAADYAANLRRVARQITGAVAR